MKDSSFLPDYKDDDVVAFNSHMQKVGSLRAVVKNVFSNISVIQDGLNRALLPYPLPSPEWFNEGANCEILRLGGKNWQKGKIRIRLSVEFYPDEPEEEISASDEVEISQPEAQLNDIRLRIKNI
jgi:hypothetical protein